jgi:response regulator NasT
MTELGSPSVAPRILVVDDDRLVLATVTDGLAEAGFDVIDADNGDDAILLAREHRPVLALLDIRMEGKSGLDVARVLREAPYRVPFLFLSAFADAQTQAEVTALGALDYLVKPMDVDQIVPRVRAALARLQAADMDKLPSAAPAVPVPALPSAPAAPADAIADPVPLAVGVLMHRHSLTRQGAWQQLQRLALAQRLSLPQQAERLLGAVEELGRSAP